MNDWPVQDLYSSPVSFYAYSAIFTERIATAESHVVVPPLTKLKILLHISLDVKKVSNGLVSIRKVSNLLSNRRVLTVANGSRVQPCPGSVGASRPLTVLVSVGGAFSANFLRCTIEWTEIGRHQNISRWSREAVKDMTDY